MVNIKRTVAVVGAGLSGLAAAVRLHDLAKNWDKETGGKFPLEIHLFEVSGVLGGRASSRFCPERNVWLDNSQHVAMNCCHELLDFLKRTELLEYWKLQREMTFCVRRPPFSGKSNLRFMPFRNSRWLPRPLHLLPALCGLKFLSRLERFELLGICQQIRKSKPAEGISISEWLDDLFCPDRVMNLFFEPVILSAFSEQLENVSARAAQKLFQEVFFSSRDGWHIWIPQRPLREIFDTALTLVLEKMGIHVHRRTSVKRVHDGRLTVSDSEAGSLAEFSADAVILAVPWFQAGKIFPELVSCRTLNPDFFEPRTIASVHFWSDRELFSCANLVLPQETIQWIFRPPFIFEEKGICYQALLSDSDHCAAIDPSVLEHLVHEELKMLFPEANFRDFFVRRSPAAVFSCGTQLDEGRPTFLTPIPSVFLAGDWTATGLPATMESAVRSGHIAAAESFEFLQNLPESTRNFGGSP